jgi:glutathione S-transferase
MQLYTSPATPFGRKAMLMLLETGLAAQTTLHEVGGSPLDPGSLPVDRNPLGKIPALVLEDGRTLYDSRVICRYLDARAGAGLYPQGEALWDVLTLEATADGILEAALLMVYESRLRPEPLRFAPWVEGQWSKVARALDAVEAGWMPLLDGPLTAAHLALGAALGYLDFRHDARGWRHGRPKLAQWAEGIAARPSMQATRPPV